MLCRARSRGGRSAGSAEITEGQRPKWSVDSRTVDVAIAISLPFRCRYFLAGCSTGSTLNPDLSVMTLAIALGVVFDGSNVTSALPFA